MMCLSRYVVFLDDYLDPALPFRGEAGSLYYKSVAALWLKHCLAGARA